MPSWLRWMPVGQANYWILQLEEGQNNQPYQSALVGTPDNKYLWVLSRQPNLSQATFDKYKKLATAQGYNINKLKVTLQSGNSVNSGQNGTTSTISIK